MRRKVEASLKLLEEMSRDGVEANEKTLSAAIKAVSSWWKEGLSDSSDSGSLMEDRWLQVTSTYALDSYSRESLFRDKR